MRRFILTLFVLFISATSYAAVPDAALLFKAIKVGDAVSVERLLKQGGDPNARDAHGMPALNLAMMRNRAAIARALFAQGADVNGVDRQGISPLALAIMRGNRGLAQWLIGNGADVNSSVAGAPAAPPLLCYAIQMYRSEIVGDLIAAGARVDAVDRNGNTALHYARARDLTEIAQLLIEHGAAPEGASSGAMR